MCNMCSQIVENRYKWRWHDHYDSLMLKTPTVLKPWTEFLACKLAQCPDFAAGECIVEHGEGKTMRLTPWCVFVSVSLSIVWGVLWLVVLSFTSLHILVSTYIILIDGYPICPFSLSLHDFPANPSLLFFQIVFLMFFSLPPSTAPLP